MKKITHLHLLLAIFVFGLLFTSIKTNIYGYGDSYFGMSFASNGYVLGDKDEEHEEEKEREEEKEEDHKEESEHEQEKEQEQEREKEHKEEGMNEEKKEQEHEEEKVETQEQIFNPNGGTTYIKRKTEGDKTEVELKTYDRSGKLVEERKLKQEENDDGEKEVEVEGFLSRNGVLEELKVKSKEGKELEISVKRDEEKKGTSVLEYNPNNQELKIKYEEQKRELSIKPREDFFEIDDGVAKAAVRLPLTVDENSGDVFVETIVGLIRVGVSPDRVAEIVKENNEDLELSDDNIELEEGGEGLEYRVSTMKKERLFGLFPVDISIDYLVNAETGEQGSYDQSFFNSFLDLISF